MCCVGFGFVCVGCGGERSDERASDADAGDVGAVSERSTPASAVVAADSGDGEATGEASRPPVVLSWRVDLKNVPGVSPGVLTITAAATDRRRGPIWRDVARRSIRGVACGPEVLRLIGPRGEIHRLMLVPYPLLAGAFELSPAWPRPDGRVELRGKPVWIPTDSTHGWTRGGEVEPPTAGRGPFEEAPWDSKGLGEFYPDPRRGWVEQVWRAPLQEPCSPFIRQVNEWTWEADFWVLSGAAALLREGGRLAMSPEAMFDLASDGVGVAGERRGGG